MIIEEIKKTIKDALISLKIDFDENKISIEHPNDISNGDYSTNVAMVAFKGRRKFERALDGDENTINVKYGVETTNPKDLAQKIVEEINKNKSKEIEKIEVAGTGFINFYLNRKFFTENINLILNKSDNYGKNDLLNGKKIMVEYTQPNPFKPFHIGHLMSNAIGESISRLVEFSDANIIRANYQGDVGPHVAKAIYGLIKFGMPDENMSVAEKAQYIGQLYVKGNDIYTEDDKAKEEIDEINKKIYEKSDKDLNKIYEWGKKITLEAFEDIYKMLGTKFDYYFFESIVAPIGEKIVKDNTGKVFEESEGAVVFKAEKYDPKLHTRVFITKNGLPTYEAKELGLTMTKFEKEKLDLSIVTTANEQEEYMKVVKKALEIMYPDIALKMKHITHGMMRLSSGKMSSRKGNVITGESLLFDSCEEILKKIEDRDFTEEEKKKVSIDVGVGALKYSILKQNIGGNIVYDFDKSISFEGDSGPYLQYAYTRSKSILEKAEKEEWKKDVLDCVVLDDIYPIEKLLYRFPEIVKRALEEYSPHFITSYLTELASSFNNFYSENVILDKSDENSNYRLAITKAFNQTIKNGLFLLGIKAPDRM